MAWPEWKGKEKSYYLLFGRDVVLPIYNIMKEAKLDRDNAMH